MDFTNLVDPIVVVPLKRLDRVTRKALRFATTLSTQVRAVQILAEEMKTDDLRPIWHADVELPAERAGRAPPRLIVVSSVYREFFGPFIDYLRQLTRTEPPDRYIAVVVPEIAERRWYNFLLRHRATLLKGLLMLHGNRRIVIVSTPWYVAE
jgi:hypothetical protein